MSKSINLIPNKEKTYNLPLLRRLRLLRFIAMGLLFSVSAASMGLYLLIAFSPLPQLRQQEQESVAAFSQVGSEVAQIALVKERSKSISTLLTKRSSFDKTLAFLQSKLPPGGEDKDLHISKNTLFVTVASQSLADIDTMLSQLVQSSQQKEVSQVNLSNLTFDTQNNMFQVTVQVILL